jgi:hypothetical protein
MARLQRKIFRGDRGAAAEVRSAAAFRTSPGESTCSSVRKESLRLFG